MNLHPLAVSIVNLLSGMYGPVVYVIKRRLIFGTVVAKVGGAWCPEVAESFLRVLAMEPVKFRVR